MTSLQQLANQFQSTGDTTYLDKALHAITKDHCDHWTPQRKAAMIQLLADNGAVLEGNLVDLILPRWQTDELKAITRQRYQNMYRLTIRFEIRWEEGKLPNTTIPILKQLISLGASSPLYDSWQLARTFWKFYKAYNRVEHMLIRYPNLEVLEGEEFDD
ncbi:MAG: hypothetical protein F6K55_03200 [Moorea sp. SIO4A3]|nr:hypothetical protein [Moorena sp. SIO4A3]